MNLNTPIHGTTPKDYLQSVDLALALVTLLRSHGEVTISTAARRFGISPSTVHRSMAMLVYRGFAVRTESRSYLPGPALGAPPLRPGVGRALVEAASPYMHAIATECGETCHLMILTEGTCHFLHSVEGTAPVRVGSRRGQVMPAELNSGGRAMLAELSQVELRRLYPDMADEPFTDFRRQLHRIRQSGIAVNRGLYESDVSAVGACLKNDLGDIVGALSIASPSSRFPKSQKLSTTTLLRHVRDLNRRLIHRSTPDTDHKWG
ncbi:IclR family transcriptional regulator [Corynebacterium tapiri]|uniref:IclR family transcriptional regulator n=2 Tax=Corynebacterium tapiri TaxID=1448266 RepID=A0A5C4U7B6_9CORY|nr:IclR family transcriptional regulator [Corynebacterium tapiri]TNM00468.1 IclR family transcriptional regulator [Corynebacterium tapiri]